MRRVVVLMLAVALLACEPVTQPTTTTDPILPPPDSVVSTTTLAVSTTEFRPVPDQVVVGAIPDGLDYRMTIPGGAIEGPIHITGDFVVEIDGERVPAAEVSYRNDGGQGSSFNNTHLLMTAAGWTIAIGFYQEVFESLGPNAQHLISNSIEATTKSGFPALALRPPFSWDYENHPPEVRFGPLVIRRFCGELAIACNDIRSVQVIPASSAYPGFEPLDEIPTVLIDSRDARSILDPSYLDPGPLSPRGLADLHWTGEELIVWGGGGFDDPIAVDGARFDPENNEWMMLPPIPLDNPIPTRSVWLGRFLLVISEEGSFSYVPGGDRWLTYDEFGIAPPPTPGGVVRAGEWLFLQNSSGIYRLSLRAPGLGWGELEVPPLVAENVQFRDRHFAAIVSEGDSLYFTHRREGDCVGKEIAEWRDESWTLLPYVSLGTAIDADCSYAYQVAPLDSGLVSWDAGHPTMVYMSESDTWVEADPIPVGGQESPSPAVPLDDRYFMVPQDGTVAFFDGDTHSWRATKLPAPGYEMVWTGSEFLAWAGDDAWRWTPPPGVLVD